MRTGRKLVGIVAGWILKSRSQLLRIFSDHQTIITWYETKEDAERAIGTFVD